MDGSERLEWLAGSQGRARRNMRAEQGLRRRGRCETETCGGRPGCGGRARGCGGEAETSGGEQVGPPSTWSKRRQTRGRRHVGLWDCGIRIVGLWGNGLARNRTGRELGPDASLLCCSHCKPVPAGLVPRRALQRPAGAPRRTPRVPWLYRQGAAPQRRRPQLQRSYLAPPGHGPPCRSTSARAVAPRPPDAVASRRVCACVFLQTDRPTAGHQYALALAWAAQARRTRTKHAPWSPAREPLGRSLGRWGAGPRGRWAARWAAGPLGASKPPRQTRPAGALNNHHTTKRSPAASPAQCE